MDDSSSAAPTLPQTPSPRRPLGGLLFRAPEPLSEHPSPSDLPSLPPLEPSAGASDAPHDAPSAPLDSDPSSFEGSTPEPERPKVVKPVDRAAITTTAIKVVEGAGTAAHQFLAKDEVDQALHVYLVTDQEAVQIGTPLGSLAARHSGGVAGLGNPDVNDLIQAGVGLALYFSRQLSLRIRARNIRAGHVQEQQLPAGPADTARDV